MSKNPDIVKEGSVGKRHLGSFMESFVNIAKGIVLGNKGMEKTASVEVKEFPEQMTIAEAEANGFFKKAKSCGWGTFATEPLDGGLGGVWFTEKGEDGKDYLVKQVSQEGEVVRRFKEKQAMKKQAEEKENKDRGIFTVYTKKPADLKGAPALGEKEAGDKALGEEKTDKKVFENYTGKPANVTEPALGKKDASLNKEAVEAPCAPCTAPAYCLSEEEIAEAMEEFSKLSPEEQARIKAEYKPEEKEEEGGMPQEEMGFRGHKVPIFNRVAVTPPGFEKTVKELKKHPEKVDNPWALSWWMKNKGYKPGGKEK